MTSRVERSPLKIPKGVEIDIQKKLIKVKGVKGTLECPMEQDVEVVLKDSELKFAPKGSLNFAIAIAGTLRALVKNMIVGVSEGYTRKLVLEGVGYRAQVQGNVLNLTLGFSHPIQHILPKEVTAETPSQTEIILKSSDKQLVGQVAATIRGYRPPECYKGKGVRYEGEVIVLKEGKKK
ncbi:MAG: 50S ribosomal protein L6 [Gammaproteobacteria bacterium GWE2_37_16]|nr:MAG: 50S ribosomal protein L6 [Gammaproteobacteria bacterium GWE2_37_16]